MHNVILLSPSWPQRIRARLARPGDGRPNTIAPGRTSLAARLDRLPAWCWPLLVAAASWPSVLWAARRLHDGSDDPLGILALSALGLALWHARARFAVMPRATLLAAAVVLIVAANLPLAGLPELVRALLASAAIVAALAAIAEHDEPIAPYAGLAILSLPLLSSLQFYAGFPLRVVTAEASRWLLTAVGSEVARVGSALTIDGHLVLVDAPCSGVQMAWVGYFTACAVALLFRVSNRDFFARLPLVGSLVLAGNIVRNTLLVAAEGRGVALTNRAHAAIGLIAFALVCAGIGGLFVRARRTPTGFERRSRSCEGLHGSRQRAVLVGILTIAALMPLAAPAASAPPAAHRSEWPMTLDGETLQPLALSPVEARFAAQFPGAIARFSAASRTVVLRDVERPTRKLHPAVDCYRGLGYAIAAERLERDSRDHRWRCFTASRDQRGLRVCERIVDADDQAYTDVSSWYWAALLGQSKGPWRAVTVAGPAVAEPS